MPIANIDYSNLNLEEMAASIGLNVKHMPILIGSFLSESEGALERLSEAVESRDYDNIREHAHFIKGSAGNLKFNELYEISKEMEFAGTDKNESFEFEVYLEAIKKAIATIKV